VEKITNTNVKPGAIIIEGHVQGLSNVRSLGEAGVPVFVVDKTSCIAQFSKYCTKYFKCPDFQLDSFADFLIELARNENINGWVLIPSNDHAVYTIAKHEARLKSYYKITSPGLNIIEQIYDKLTLIQLAEVCGVPVPKTWNFSKIDVSAFHDLSFPVLTKGRFGLSFYRTFGKKAFLANSADDFVEQTKHIEEKAAISNIITQELIPFDGSNKTISYTAFCEMGTIKAWWMGEKIREHPLKFGTATFARSVNVEVCHLQSIPLLKALQYNGVCEVEYLFDPRDQQYKLIEINPRTWLWVGLAKACGVDFAMMLYNMANGATNNFPSSYDEDVYWINPVSDTVFSMVSIFKGYLSPSAYFTSLLKGKKINALLNKSDWKPAAMYLFNVFSFLSNR
jgi:D-aspartate ligase